MTVLAAVLAAGAGTRFGPGAKLDAPFRGSTVLGSALASAVAAGLHETVVVVARTHRAASATAAGGVTVLVNPRPGDGLASSLQVALAHARRRGHHAVVVGLGDQPLLDPEAWRRVAGAVGTVDGAAGTASVAPIVFASYGGRRGHPVGLAAAVWSLLPTAGERGAGELAQLRPDLVGEVPCPGNPTDIDTPADLARWSGGPGDAEEGEGAWS